MMASRIEEMRRARSESLATRPSVANGSIPPARAGGGRNEGLRMLTGASRIKLDRIMGDPGQPRKTFGTEADSRLAENMRIRGQLVPALVRWSAEADRYIVIDGERRYRAAIAAGLAELAVVVEDEADPDTILELQLITNALREEVAPVEQARAYQRLIEARGLTRRQLGEKLAIDQSAITKALDLLDLSATIQDQVDAGAIAASTATLLARIGDPAEQEALAGRVVAESLSRADVAEAVKPLARSRRATGKAKSKGKAKVVTSQTFKGQGGYRITVERTKGIEPAALVEALELFLAEAKAKLP